jgi:riboflavin transporter FmnP
LLVLTVNFRLMSAYRKLAAVSLVFAALAVMLMCFSFAFVQRVPPSLQGTLTEWVYWCLVAVFGLVAVLYCAMAYGLAFRVVDELSIPGDTTGARMIKRLTGFYVPGGKQTDFLLISRAGGLWLVPSKPQPRK